MKKSAITLIISALSLNIYAQFKPYKIKFGGADKKVMINVQSAPIIIQGIEGDEFSIEQTGENRKEMPKEAEGLRMVTGGVLDNTGTGANVEVEGNSLKVMIPKSRYTGTLLMKIPKNLHLFIREDNTAGEQRWTISDYAGEIELKTNYSKVYLNDITGPLVANTGYGKIFVTYSKLTQNSPSSISASGAIDVTLPADSKAHVKMRSYYGDIFTDFDLATIKKETKPVASSSGTKTLTTAVQSLASSPKSSEDCNCDDDNNRSWSSGSYAVVADAKGNQKDIFEGTINGGGVAIELKSSNGNIYLRKKK